jgi:hypothetical protein
MRIKALIAIACFTGPLWATGQPPAPDAASATVFLASAYSRYGKNGKGAPFNGRYFHSSLLALMNADIKANGPNNAPAIDFDPICGCQDWDGIWDLKIDVHVETPQRARATVAFALAPPKDRPKDAQRKLEITLVPEHGAWRIYDILDESDPAASTPALRKLLQSDIASLRGAANKAQAP